MTELDIFLTVLKGMGAGFFYALVGYIKNLPSGSYTFDWKKAGPALIVGAVAGVVAIFQNTDILAAVDYLGVVGIVALVTFLWNLIVKAVKNKKEIGTYFIKANK